MPRPSFHPRRHPQPTRRAARVIASQELRTAVHANRPDWYPDPPDNPEDDPRRVLPFMALEWQYISVFLIVSGTVLLIRLDDVCATDPKVWTPPFGRHNRIVDAQRSAARTLYADTGIDFPHDRLELIDDCVISISGFGGNTNHKFYVAEWTDDDGEVPNIPVPVGAVERQFFAAEELPLMSVPYVRNLIEAYLRR